MGHRKVWAMTRHDGHPGVAVDRVAVPDERLILGANYQRACRRRAVRPRVASAKELTDPNPPPAASCGACARRCARPGSTGTRARIRDDEERAAVTR